MKLLASTPVYRPASENMVAAAARAAMSIRIMPGLCVQEQTRWRMAATLNTLPRMALNVRPLDRDALTTP